MKKQGHKSWDGVQPIADKLPLQVRVLKTKTREKP
jgi:hypothetical protein